MTSRQRLAVVGGGILGLAHAWAAARRGHRVTLFERDRRAQSASARNFGLIWPIGQPIGKLRELALKSRQLWLDASGQAGFSCCRSGSLHLAEFVDEWAVLNELFDSDSTLSDSCALLTPSKTAQLCPAVRQNRLVGALHSTTEMCVDPRQVLTRLPRWLGDRFAVQLRFNEAVRRIAYPQLETAGGAVESFDRIMVCTGSDFELLYPELYRSAPLVRCKLQMMRTEAQPDGWQLGPAVVGGLTLRHYGCFAGCPSLEVVKSRVAEQMPELDRFGIHVMAAENPSGNVILGDSHEYGSDISPFDKVGIDQLILREISKLIELPHCNIDQRWHGIYAKHATEPVYVNEVESGVTVMTGLGGAGMTLSFGLAEQFWAE